MTLLTDLFDRPLGNKAAFLSYVLALLAVLVAAQTFLSWYRLRHIPGPFSAKLSTFWMFRHIGGTNMHLDLYDACKKYGPLVRIGPSHLTTSDPEVMKRMLAARSPYRRSSWYISMRYDPTSDNIESEPNEERHAHLRQMMAAGYSGKENESLERTIDWNVANFIKLINTKYISTETEYRPLDFGRKAQYFTLDAISHLSYGEPLGFLTTDSDVHEYIRTTEQVLPVVIFISIYPWLNWVLQLPIFKSLLPSEKDPLGFGKIKGITKEVVAKRFGPNKVEQRDMLGSFIRHGMNQEELESETIVQLLAGSDTTATAIRSTMLNIITNPRVLSRLQAEISSAEISSPIQDSEAKKLPYLQAIIKEGLRTWPPIAALLAKEVPPEGDVINGMFVPGGTQIGWCSWGIFRNKQTFGEDADTFRPERWLEGSPEKIKLAEQTMELAFSYGKHHCLGKNVALMELNKVFVELFRRFDITIADPMNPWKCECHGIFMLSEMWMVVTKREAEL